MPEVKRPVTVKRVTYECDACEGDVQSTGRALMSNPPIYLHECVNCGKEYRFRTHYPTLVYETVPIVKGTTDG